MSAAIDEVTQEIEASETSIMEWNKSIRDLEWEAFDLAQERISKLNDEAEFFIELMSNKKLYDDNGQLTDEGKATMGMHGQQYNTHMRLADNYGAEAAKLNEEIAKDPYNQDLINRRDELLDLQRDSILAAESEKNAIRDLVEEGINLELDALQERIDKQNESLQSARDLYEYNKKVKDQTKEIANLEKQMAAYSGDDSEEARQKIQQIKVQLEEAKENLQETEMDKYISDQEKLLDNLYNEYETILNSRLDNIDGVLSDTLAAINENAGTIAQTIDGAAGKVGYTMSEEMSGVWEEAKAADDADREQRVSQTQAIVDSLTTTGGLLPSKAQEIIDTLGKGSVAEALNTKSLVDQMVANGEITREEANKIIAALSTGDQEKVYESLNTIDQLVADGKMTKTEADGKFALQSAMETALAGKVDNATLEGYYTKEQVDGIVDDLATADNVYTKGEVDAKIASELEPYAKTTDVEGLVAPKADKSYVDTELGKKANSADVYTKTQVDEMFQWEVI
jgi:polyhydroxyalkanoate synthesis regulator phasin